MFLLEAYDIEKQYGSRTVLSFKELRIYRGDKIGIVGSNGAGKTTLLKILAGELMPDKGTLSSHTKIHFLKQFAKEDSTLSGGENQKKQVLGLHKNTENLIFADEPTANLDAEGRDWLQSQLEQAQTIVMISHDRNLLDNVCTSIIEVKDAKLEFYTGNYTDYINQLEQKKHAKEQEYSEYNKKKLQLEKAMQQKQKSIDRSRQGFKQRRITNESETRLGKSRIQLTYAKKQQELKTLRGRVERLGEVEHPQKERKIRIDFSKTDPPQNKRIISANSFSFSYGADKIFDKARFEVFREEKLAIVGDNGAGKTTLMREIVNGNSDIDAAPKVKIGYLRQNFSQLDMTKTVLENTLANSIQTREVVFSVLAGLLFTKTELDKPASVLSGGERVRLGLAMLVVSDVNTLFLDEPTNYLDIPSLTALENTLIEYPGAVVLISHDQRFVDRVANRKLIIKDKKIVQEAQNKPKVKTNLLALEIQRTRLVEELSTANGTEKEMLEKEYSEVMLAINNTK